MSPPEVLATLGEDLLVQLATAALEILNMAAGAGTQYVKGQTISEQIMMMIPAEAARAKHALGGKGWLRAFMATVEGASSIEVENVGEPCYCLSGSYPMGGRLAGVVQARDARLPRVTAPTAAAVPRGSAGIQPDPYWQGSPDDAIYAFCTGVEEVLGHTDEGWLSGSVLIKRMETTAPELLQGAKLACTGKGWLKRVIDRTPTIAQVVVEGINEPCYCLASAAANAAFFTKPPKAEKPIKEEAEEVQEEVQEEQVATAAPTAQRTTAFDSLDPEVVNLLVETAMQAISQSATGALEGNRMQKALTDACPEESALVKTALNGKGWLKKLFQLDARVEICGAETAPTFRVADYDAPAPPAYQRVAHIKRQIARVAGSPGVLKALARPTMSPTAQAAVAAGEPPVERHPKQPRASSPEEVLQALGEEDFHNLTQLCIQSLQLVTAEKPYLEGSVLSGKVRLHAPDLAVRAKAALGDKGWLKVVLEAEPSVERVEVQGRGEPCWRLAG